MYQYCVLTASSVSPDSRSHRLILRAVQIKAKLIAEMTTLTFSKHTCRKYLSSQQKSIRIYFFPRKGGITHHERILVQLRRATNASVEGVACLMSTKLYLPPSKKRKENVAEADTRSGSGTLPLSEWPAAAADVTLQTKQYD